MIMPCLASSLGAPDTVASTPPSRAFISDDTSTWLAVAPASGAAASSSLLTSSTASFDSRSPKWAVVTSNGCMAPLGPLT